MATTSFPKDKIKIVLFEKIHPVSKETFQKAGYSDVTILDRALPEDELIECIKDVSLVGVRSKTQLTEKVLSHAKKLWAVGCFCIGTNQVDLDYATQNGIAVFNSPYSNTRSVAELVIGEIIMLARRIPEKSSAAMAGKWLKEARGAFELRGKTLGIIGYGHIGSQVSVLAEALGLRVIFYDIESKLPLGNASSVGSMDEILEQSHFVTLHVPQDPGTVNLMNREAIEKMQPDSYLLNLSRGSVVDIEAAVEHLKSGHLAGAAFDVYPQEPKSKEEPFHSPLLELAESHPNLILTPHIGGSTQEAQQNIGEDAATKLIQYMDRGTTSGSKTLPPLNLSSTGNVHRILHIHHNKAGVLSAINDTFAKAKINILGQHLKTNEQIGYVVTDVEAAASEEALDQVKKIEHTIKARVLF